MPSSVCGDPMMCQNCKKSVPNAIFHVYHRRGFHYPAQKCEENFILFLIKGEMLVNSREYAGTMLKAGEFMLQPSVENRNAGHDRCGMYLLSV